jgi:acyl-CoA synthetase (AMP-forming)/AMP-acid ligase II
MTSGAEAEAEDVAPEVVEVAVALAAGIPAEAVPVVVAAVVVATGDLDDCRYLIDDCRLTILDLEAATHRVSHHGKLRLRAGNLNRQSKIGNQSLLRAH